MDDLVTLNIRRDGICMGDDAFDHTLSLIFHKWDAIDTLTLLKIIDQWLIRTTIGTLWHISTNTVVLGTITLCEDDDLFDVTYHEDLLSLGFSLYIYCSHM